MKILKLTVFFVICFCSSCSESKKNAKSGTKKDLPIYFEMLTNENVNKDTEKNYNSLIKTALKSKDIEVIDKEEAQKLLQNEMLVLFDLYKKKELSVDKYKDELAKKINSIPSVARKLVFKLFNDEMKIDSVFIVSALFTNVYERERPDSIKFINYRSATSELFIREIIDSCDKKIFFR
jgi:hypothetical protein